MTDHPIIMIFAGVGFLLSALFLLMLENFVGAGLLFGLYMICNKSTKVERFQ